MKSKKNVVFDNKLNNKIVKTIVIKYSMPTNKEFIKLFNSVGWQRNKKRVSENRKHTKFAVSIYVDKTIIGMGRVVSDGSYFTIYDIVVDKDYQGLGIGSLIMREIIEWYKTIEDDDTFLYVNASKNKEKFYQKFGFKIRPNEDVGAGMKWYRD